MHWLLAETFLDPYVQLAVSPAVHFILALLFSLLHLIIFFFARKRKIVLLRNVCTILSNILLDTSWSRESPDGRMPCSLCQLSKLMCYPITLSFRMDHYPLQKTFTS